MPDNRLFGWISKAAKASKRVGESIVDPKNWQFQLPPGTSDYLKTPLTTPSAERAMIKPGPLVPQPVNPVDFLRRGVEAAGKVTPVGYSREMDQLKMEDILTAVMQHLKRDNERQALVNRANITEPNRYGYPQPEIFRDVKGLN